MSSPRRCQRGGGNTPGRISALGEGVERDDLWFLSLITTWQNWASQWAQPGHLPPE
jgi:hypothetical protein